MKTARWMVFGLALAMLAGPGSTGCSCSDQGGQVAKDLNLLATPNYLAFGTVPLNGQKSLTVTLTHVGLSGTVVLADIELDDLGSEFTFTRPDKASLEVGESTTITVTYAPLVATSPDGALVVRHNVAVLGGITRIPVTANGQVGDIVVEPNPIDFEQVDVGTDKLLDVLLRNDGSDSVVLNTISLRLDGSSDFTIEAINLPDSATMPFTLAPTDSIGLVLKYKPMNGGADTSTLVVEGGTQGQYAAWSFDVTGEEMGPRLVASPGQIDFQWVPLQTQATRMLMVENQGNADLVIPAGGIVLWPGSDESIVVLDAPAEDTKIAPGGNRTFNIGWTPTIVLPDDGTSIGQLMITSNDLAQSPTAIPIYGRADAPILTVIPTTVDMGFGAQMTPVERQLTLRNDGHGTLEVAGMSIVDVSDTRFPDEFQLVRGTEKAAALAAFQIAGAASEGVKILFTNKAALEDKGQTVTATIRIVSNYLGHETIDVPVTITRSDAPICNIAMVPMTLNYGTVAIGWTKEMPVNLVNIGTGYCSFKGSHVGDCQTSVFGGVTCGSPFVGTPSNAFKILNPPPISKNGLAPGSTTSMTVQFNPPSGGSPLFGLLNQYAALISFKVYDETLKKEITIPKGTGTPVTYAANIQGASGIAKISVLPGEVDFGVTTIGCFSKTYKVCIYNSGNAPLMVNNVLLKGCTPEFKVKNIPKLPIAVPNGAPKCIETVYAPQDEGDDECMLQIDATDKSSPSVVVKLSGSGTYDTSQVDEFTQVTGQEVDILFVIDDSGSMSEEQDRLTDSFSEFISQANVWNNDFHLGGISVNVTDDQVIGRLNRGDTSITPRFMTKANSNPSTFARMIDYGTGGNSDSQEAGLQAAQNALSAPLSSDTGVACGTDNDCKNDTNICPDAAGCAYTCIEGTCGGFNSRFVRDDAQLELLMLSDEEDQSSGGLPFYIDFFKNIKGWYNVDMMHVNAIVGMDGGSAGSCTASDGGTGAGGYRYVEVVKATNGLAGSICDSSYAGIMKKVGDVTFHPKVQFFLSRLADPATVSVQVNGTACTSGWRYDAPSNSVIFDEAGACMPGPGDKIRVSYETLCLTS